MKYTKKEQGITLIALIITIIVMLILVAVTVTVALRGGIFDKARTAENGMKSASEREQLQDFIVGKLDVTNNTILSTLGSITIDGITYDVSAEEITEEGTNKKNVKITLEPTTTANGEITKIYYTEGTGENSLKISGVEVLSNWKFPYYSYKFVRADGTGREGAILLYEENSSIMFTVLIKDDADSDWYIAFPEDCPVQLDTIDNYKDLIADQVTVDVFEMCEYCFYSEDAGLIFFTDDYKTGWWALTENYELDDRGAIDLSDFDRAGEH